MESIVKRDDVLPLREYLGELYRCLVRLGARVREEDAPETVGEHRNELLREPHRMLGVEICECGVH